ncbi:hypothetical protein EIP91_011189 [Steccherinum ochraceum]|uniref:Uncharacterized protein n=1 Tax=Steccherinum ochraceum TaxID=92696 RepID=A0A4R0R7R3_9APHY|nr:hypothetical protein EIP91_011189 [Steccherinum ochraceum]
MWTVWAGTSDGKNVTIDDQFGDEETGAQVVYAPSEHWTQGNGCGGCSAKPDASQAYRETWHDGLFAPSQNKDPLTLTFSFTGTAVYLFNIMPRQKTTTAEVALDGQVVKSISITEDVSDQFVYNVPIFSMDSIANGQHTITVTTTGDQDSLMLFDRAIYTSRRVSQVISPLPFSTPRDPPASPTSVLSLEKPFPVTFSYPGDRLTESDPASSTLDGASSIALQEQLQFFRKELQALRSRTTLTPTTSKLPAGGPQVTSGGNGAPLAVTPSTGSSSRGISSLASEIALLRTEVAQLRMKQQATDDAMCPVSIPSVETGMQRELALLRSEMEELRIAQQMDALPAYTPSSSGLQFPSRGYDSVTLSTPLSAHSVSQGKPARHDTVGQATVRPRTVVDASTVGNEACGEWLAVGGGGGPYPYEEECGATVAFLLGCELELGCVDELPLHLVLPFVGCMSRKRALSVAGCVAVAVPIRVLARRLAVKAVRVAATAHNIKLSRGDRDDAEKYLPLFDSHEIRSHGFIGVIEHGVQLDVVRHCLCLLSQFLGFPMLSVMVSRALQVLALWVVWAGMMEGKNVTIDDQYGDEATGAQVTYAPAELWTQGNGCGGCSAKPDASQAYHGTWHDGLFAPSQNKQPLTVTFTFTGTAVYLFNILPQQKPTSAEVSLDGRVVKQISITEDVSSQFVYNVPMFAMDGIANGQHTVTLTTTGNQDSLMLFDYAVYTTEDSPPSSPPPSSPPPSSPSPPSDPSSPSPPASPASPSSPASSSPGSPSSPASPSSPSSSPSPSSPSSPSNPSNPSNPSSPSSASSHDSSSSDPSGSSGSSPSSPSDPSSPSSSSSPPLTPVAAAAQEHHRSNLGAIVGGVVGGIVLLVLCLLALVLWRRSRSKRASEATSPIPFSMIREPVAPPATIVLSEKSPIAESMYPDHYKVESGLPYFGSASSVDEGPSESIALQQQLQFFRNELEALRARAAVPPSKTSTGSLLGESDYGTQSHITARSSSSPGISSLASEIAALRSEMASLRTRHETIGTLTSPVLTSPVDPGMQRELALLRSELEEIRMTQHIDVLPAYTPPPPRLEGHSLPR